MPESLPAAAAFVICRTQWNYAPSGLPTGLRYGDCLAVLQARRADLGLPADGDLSAVIADLQGVERAYVNARVEVWERERITSDQHR